MNTNCTDSLNTISSGFLDIVSANVARIRNEKGISQLKLSNEIGLSGSAYYGRMEIRASIGGLDGSCTSNPVAISIILTSSFSIFLSTVVPNMILVNGSILSFNLELLY